MFLLVYACSSMSDQDKMHIITTLWDDKLKYPKQRLDYNKSTIQSHLYLCQQLTK